MLDSLEKHQTVGIFHDPALEKTKGNQVTTLEDKEAIVRRAAFPHSYTYHVGLSQHRDRQTHQRVDETTIRRTPFNKSQKKAPGADRINFSGLCIE